MKIQCDIWRQIGAAPSLADCVGGLQDLRFVGSNTCRSKKDPMMMQPRSKGLEEMLPRHLHAAEPRVLGSCNLAVLSSDVPHSQRSGTGACRRLYPQPLPLDVLSSICHRVASTHQHLEL